MRIGELAQRSGVSVRSLRYYEERGLIASERGPRGQRHCHEEDVQRVLFLQRLFTAGLSSRAILELLPCVDSPSFDNSRAALERMAQEREKLSSHIIDLINTRDALDSAMARAARGPAGEGSATDPRIRRLVLSYLAESGATGLPASGDAGSDAALSQQAPVRVEVVATAGGEALGPDAATRTPVQSGQQRAPYGSSRPKRTG